MTHFLKKLVAAWFILGSVAVGFAQQMPPIPTDANVRIGKLNRLVRSFKPLDYLIQWKFRFAISFYNFSNRP